MNCTNLRQSSLFLSLSSDTVSLPLSHFAVMLLFWRVPLFSTGPCASSASCCALAAAACSFSSFFLCFLASNWALTHSVRMAAINTVLTMDDAMMTPSSGEHFRGRSNRSHSGHILSWQKHISPQAAVHSVFPRVLLLGTEAGKHLLFAGHQWPPKYRHSPQLPAP